MYDNLVCGHCGATGNVKRYKRTTPLCWSHYLQMRRHGKILERTKYTPNKFTINGDTCEITLYEGERTPVETAYVDADDFNLVSQYKWHRASRKGKPYVETYVKRKSVFLHMLIMGVVAGCEIDHRDANTLNNRRSNLRHLTHHQNILNARTIPKSGRMGVTWRESRQCWVARIIHKGKATQRHFKTKEEAIECRREWERSIVGATVEDIRR